jgi:glycosyltransferase involved in cell wall biosynthesis
MVSVIIPVFNEAASLRELHEELMEMARKHALDLDVMYVDDGSTDGSWEVITGLARTPPSPPYQGGDRGGVRGIRFRRNFGKAAALAAGARAAHGDIVCTLDSDLQDDPAELPRFLAELEKGYEVVSGWKKVRHDPWHKVVPSWLFNHLVSWLTGVKLHDHNCGMKAYRAEVFREIRLYGELHRFIPVLAHARGFRVGELVIQHRPRKYGRSKYGLRRFMKGFLDLLTVKFLTGFGGRPQHLLGTIGLLAFLAGLAGMAYLAVIWLLRLWRPDDFAPLHTRPLLTYSAAALILGAQLMSIGSLAELITAYQWRDEDAYSIAEQIDGASTSFHGGSNEQV